MSGPRIDRQRARDILSRCHAPLGTDFHALRTWQVDSIVSEADAYGYRKPRNANGSRARYFHAYLVRAANREES